MWRGRRRDLAGEQGLARGRRRHLPGRPRSGARAPTDAGVADRIVWARHDFSRSIPEGPFDLVSAHFLHSPVDDPRDPALRAAAAAVAPDGTLLVVSHEAVPWHEHVEFPTATEVLDALGIDRDEWTVERLGSRGRRAKTPDGVEVDVTDSVVRLAAFPIGALTESLPGFAGFRAAGSSY